jgi:PPM family protein phosphatase
MRYVTRNEGFDGPTHDFVDVIERADATVFVLADAAGSGGDETAGRILRIGHDMKNSRDAYGLGRQLTSADMPGGESTAVIISVFPGGLIGASVGDSGAWLLQGERWRYLTSGQNRKPLVGSGEAKPVTFLDPARDGILLIASDGLFKYAPPERIREVAAQPDLDSAATQLVNLVRFQSGRLSDDVSLILCQL